MEHPLFEKVRNKEKEAVTGNPVTLEFEKDELDSAKLRELILAECDHYKQKWGMPPENVCATLKVYNTSGEYLH